MKKIKLVSAIMLTSIGIITIGGTAQAVSYPSATEGTSDVKASVIMGTDGGPEIPPVDPEVGPPIIPIDPNPNVGPLSLRYASDLTFSEIEVSTSAVTVFAEQDTDVNDEPFDNMVTIQDFRGDSERDGWELTVTMKNDFIPGSQLKMTPFIHATKLTELELEVPSSQIILNNQAQVFARTTSSPNPTGIVSIGLADPNSNGVELTVPANTPTGDYETTLNWELVSGPVPPPVEP